MSETAEPITYGSALHREQQALLVERANLLIAKLAGNISEVDAHRLEAVRALLDANEAHRVVEKLRRDVDTLMEQRADASAALREAVLDLVADSTQKIDGDCEGVERWFDDVPRQHVETLCKLAGFTGLDEVDAVIEDSPEPEAAAPLETTGETVEAPDA